MTKNHKTISNDVMEVLKASTITSNSVMLPAGQLPRKLYEAVNSVLTLAGGKWSRKDKAHVFDKDPRKLLGLAMESGEILDEKKQRQAFYTPSDVADDMVICLEAGFSQSKRIFKVLEPSAGAGALIRALRSYHDKYALGKVPDRFDVTAVEIDPDAAASLREQRVCQEVWSMDFLSFQPDEVYDGILMNPPFQNLQYAAHIDHALTLLAPGGVLVAVVPESFHQDMRLVPFRLRTKLGNYETRKLGSGAFKESGTNVACSIITVREELIRKR